MNYGHMSINVPFFKNRQPSHSPSVVIIEDKTEVAARLGGFFSLVAMETIVLPSSFLPCIPPHNAMKSKLPFDKADWSGVWKRRGWQLGRLKDAREQKKKTCPRKAKWGYNRCSLTGHFVFSGLCVTWYQVDRFYLWLPAAPSQTADYLKSEEITNTH